MLFSWFDTRESIAFAKAVARDINELFPPEINNSHSFKSKKQKRKFDGLLNRTQAFVSQHKLNMYKTAKILNTIKWQMLDAGQDETRVEEVIILMIELLKVKG